MDFIRKLQELNDDEGLLRSYDHELAEKEEARREGKEEGKEEGREETAKKMLRDGLSIDIVQKYTGLSEHKIKNIITMM